MGLIFECIYLGIVFINEHVRVFIFCFDYVVSYLNIEKENEISKKKKKKNETEKVFVKCWWIDGCKIWPYKRKTILNNWRN